MFWKKIKGFLYLFTFFVYLHSFMRFLPEMLCRQERIFPPQTASQGYICAGADDYAAACIDISERNMYNSIK